MEDKLAEIKKRFEEVGELLVLPETMADMKKYSGLSKEYKDLEKVVKTYDAYTTSQKQLAEAKEVLKTEKDEEFREMVKMEIEELGPKTEELQEELKQALIPKDPNDEKNAIKLDK